MPRLRDAWLASRDSRPCAAATPRAPTTPPPPRRRWQPILEVLVHASHLRGRRFSLADEDEEGSVRFVWEDDPTWLYPGTLYLQADDRITHIDGFEVQNARWTTRIFHSAIERNRIFRCYVLLEGRACAAPSLRESLMML